MPFDSELKRLERMRDDNLEEIKKYRADLVEKLIVLKKSILLSIQDGGVRTVGVTLIPFANKAVKNSIPFLLSGKANERFLKSGTELLDHRREILKDV